MRVLSVNVGMPRSGAGRDKGMFTGGVKVPVESAALGRLNFAGDAQADLTHHGGPDRSACVYPAGHYQWWRSAHGVEMEYGMFGENLTVEGAREEAICIGDTFRLGGALVQVTLPRDPCRTLDRINGFPSLSRLARESGRCGFHMRTLEEGAVRRGDLFEPVDRHPAGITVAAVLDLYHGRSRDAGLLARLIEMPEFAEEGKRELTRRLA